MKLHNIIETDMINVDCTATNAEDVLEEITLILKSKNKISNENLTLKKLIEREKLGSTSIGNHSAVPHTKLKGISEPIIFIAISKKGILYNKKDKTTVHLIILILSPIDAPIIHLQILAAAASLIKKSDKLINEILAINSPEELMKIIKKYENIDD